MKKELKLDAHTIFYFNDNDSFVTKDGKRIEFISLRKVKFQPDSQKPKVQTITFTDKDKEAVLAWLKSLL